MSRLVDLVNAGVVCTWAGVQRRPLVALTEATAQSRDAIPQGYAEPVCEVEDDPAPLGVGTRAYRPWTSYGRGGVGRVRGRRRAGGAHV